jgi:hypothetical protein
MKIEVIFKKKDEMKYDTWDYYYYKEDGSLVFEIANTGVDSFNRLLLIHAMIEELLAQKDGITIKQIDEFDHSYHGKGEPGEEVKCPYRDAHVTAKGVEMILCAKMGIPWKVYEENLCDE